MKTFKLSLLVALFAFAGNALALDAVKTARLAALKAQAVKNEGEQKELSGLVAEEAAEVKAAADAAAAAAVAKKAADKARRVELKKKDALTDAEKKELAELNKAASAVTGSELADLENKAANDGDAVKNYKDALADASYLTRLNAFGRNHKACMAKGAAALIAAGAVGYYIGTRVEKAEVTDELPA